MISPHAKPIEKLAVPVMLVYSDQDHIFPQNYVESFFSRLTCQKNDLLLKDREHLIMTNHVDEVSPAVVDFPRKTMNY
ncbi:MAG: hypothetical protein KKD44_10310 [Proteobacteria bacterium]|nr:hypothetical protein [Pseudomonadota bacterium]